jgi:DNA helicase II / ATP-dependent DNA helicase PcrA
MRYVIIALCFCSILVLYSVILKPMTEQKLSISQRAMMGQGNQVAVPEFLRTLNPEQRAAADALDGPVLVLAGAGTGKTRVLTSRLANLIHSNRARAWEILSVTFTNKAAKEMRERCEKLLGSLAGGLSWLGTFHSLSSKILRRHAELIGLKSTFTIIDTDDQIRLLKQIIEANNIDAKRHTPRALAGLIDGWKNKALRPEQVPAGDAFLFAEGKGIRLYQEYQNRLKTLNCADFGDLLLLCIELFTKNPDLLKEYQSRFKYILVDEYQDTNVAQYLWLRLLASGHKNLCVVGDDDQSIYGWRGAEVENILRFEKDFPNTKTIRLERNYRSTNHILAAASHIIANNSERLGKTLWTEDENGEKVKVRGVWDGEAEARLISDDIESLFSKGVQYQDMAILVRASWQMRAFEDRFLMIGLPYKVIGGPRFFERQEIRDAMAYFRLMRHTDDDLAFERIVNQPKRGVGDTSLKKIMLEARENGVSLFTMADNIIERDAIKGPARSGLIRFIDSIKHWRKKKEDISHIELAELVLDESGYIDMWRNDKTPTAQTRIENLQELVRSMGQFETLDAFLEHVELVMDIDRDADGDAIQILTLHAAKGLEWPVVFLPGWEEEVFPSPRAINEIGQKALEEERRLAYVGITRAREIARISFAANRQIYGKWQSVLPSRFIDELPEDNVDAISETGYFNRPAFGGASNLDAYELGTRGAGFMRAQQAQTQKYYAGTGASSIGNGPLLEAKAKLITQSKSKSNYDIGQRVFHDKFGYGRILSTDNDKVEVAFEKAGTKKLISSFIKPA